MDLHSASGNLAAFIAASLFGASVVATRVVVQEIPPFNLAVVRFGQGGLILFLCLFIGARDMNQLIDTTMWFYVKKKMRAVQIIHSPMNIDHSFKL